MPRPKPVRVTNQIITRSIQKTQQQWQPNHGIPKEKLGRFMAAGVGEACKLGFVIGAGLGIPTLFSTGLLYFKDGYQTGDYSLILCGLALQGLYVGGTVAAAYYIKNNF